MKKTTFSPNKYKRMSYRRCGQTGLNLPFLSLGLWHNFGEQSDFGNMKQILFSAFDNGITSFDLANNYGPPSGSSELNFGKIFSSDLTPYRDELIISTKAGHLMWDGPYGDWGSRKHLIASIDQSLNRMGLKYVDIFYSHRPDPNTPLEETMQALADIVSSGKALYIGLSKYSLSEFRQAVTLLKQMGRIPIIYQGNYSIIERSIEDGVIDEVANQKCGLAAFSPLAQGLLSDKYLSGIPTSSRAAGESIFLTPEDITSTKIKLINKLNLIAQDRNQTLAQMAISWLLKDERVSTVITGASTSEQLLDSIKAVKRVKFEKDELTLIDNYIKEFTLSKES